MLSGLARASVENVFSGMTLDFGIWISEQLRKNGLSIIIWILAIVVLFGSVVLPFMAGARIFRWHPMTRQEWDRKVALPWVGAAALGGLLMWLPIYIIYVEVSLGQNIDREVLASNATAVSVGLTFLFFALGTIRGVMQRQKRKEAYGLGMKNQSKLDEWGIVEFDGGEATHKDSEGNHLILETVTSQIVEFGVKGQHGMRAYIEIDSQGQFEKFSGIVPA